MVSYFYRFSIINSTLQWHWW